MPCSHTLSGVRRPDRRRPAAALLLLALLCAPGLAAARWYQVEVIVFKHNGESATGGEQWPEGIALPDFGNSIELVTDLTDLAGAPAAAAGPQAIAFKPLERNERLLIDTERRLRNSREYAPLLAVAWRQPNFGVVGARHVYLSDQVVAHDTAAGRGETAAAAGSAEPVSRRVMGTVTVKVARLMNVDVDFVFDNDGVPVRLTATRKVKLREIHYFDHPLFGVIVQVVPYALPNEDPVKQVTADEPEDVADDSGVGGPGPSPRTAVPAAPPPKPPKKPSPPPPAAPKMRMKPSTE